MEKPDKAFLDGLKACRKEMYAEGEVTTLKQLLTLSKKHYTGRVQFAEKIKKETVYYSVDKFYDDVSKLGQSLLNMGLHRGNAAIVGENSYAWLTAFFAINCSGNIAVPLDRELSDEKLVELAEKGDCKVMFFTPSYSGTAKLFLSGGEGRHAICISGTPRGDGFYKAEELKSQISDITEFESITSDKDDTAAIVFTSGTTGANKGVCLSHGNFCSNFSDIALLSKPVSTAISVLPMNHTYELSCIELTAIYTNTILYINDSLRNFKANMKSFKPEAMAAVPKLMSVIYDGIIDSAQKSGRLEKLRKGVKLSSTLLKHHIDIRHILFKDIIKEFGYALPIISVGGAPIDCEKAAFLEAVGFRIYAGYGLTEGSPIVTLNCNVAADAKNVGVCLPGCEIRIADPDEDGTGEIEIRGKNVTHGYYKDKEADKLSFTPDGWFKTGDYGRLGKNRELYIAGRKKNIIILDNGKNIYTEELEEHFMQGDRLIKEAVVLVAGNDNPHETKKHLALAVAVDPETVGDRTKEQLEADVNSAVARLNRSLPPYERISDVMTVVGEFNKTSTMKIIRRDVEEMYLAYRKGREE